MNISAKFNKKQSNECSDISVKNTNVNFLLHTKSSHLFLHNRKKKYSQHVVLLGQRKHLSMFEKYFPNRSVCRSWLQSRPNNMLSLSDLHVFTGCQLTNQNCCSCLQGEIDTCRSASIRGYIIRGSSVSFKQSLRHDSVRRWRGGRRAVTAPQLQQTHWPHSTWCGSPTWQYSSLKTHRQAEEITPNHTWNTCFYDSIYKPVLWASYSIDQKKKQNWPTTMAPCINIREANLVWVLGVVTTHLS